MKSSKQQTKNVKMWQWVHSQEIVVRNYQLERIRLAIHEVLHRLAKLKLGVGHMTVEVNAAETEVTLNDGEYAAHTWIAVENGGFKKDLAGNLSDTAKVVVLLVHDLTHAI